MITALFGCAESAVSEIEHQLFKIDMLTQHNQRVSMVTDAFCCERMGLGGGRKTIILKDTSRTTPCTSNMWQSSAEIEGYSITYFDHIAAFEAPYR